MLDKLEYSDPPTSSRRGFVGHHWYFIYDQLYLELNIGPVPEIVKNLIRNYEILIGI